MKTLIYKAAPKDYDELLSVWEASVRSTHHFLAEEDILFYKPLVREQYIPATNIYIVRNNREKIAGFIGLSENEIEMLFIHPDEQGKGYGSRLTKFATGEKHVTRVDVNEQNEAAFGFYRHLGFLVTGRDALDPCGKPYPILHMQLKNTPELESTRLILRPFRENDSDVVFACCQNPELGNNAGWKPHETAEESLEIIRSVFMPQKYIWAVTLKDSGRLIGCVGIIPDPKRQNPQAQMLGYWLDETYWGKGYMTEAIQKVLQYGFEVLHVDIISAYCYPHNLRSRNTLERNGFLYEGILHEAELMYDAKMYDNLCFYRKRDNH